MARSHVTPGQVSIINANSRQLPLADNSVDLVVTSPPYFALRSYEDNGEHYAGQVGDEPTPQEFIESLLIVTRECVRVLKPTGSLFVNLGDKYAGGGLCDTGGPNSVNKTYGDRSKKAVDRNVGGFKSKTLMGLPWRYALACIDELGLILRAEIIWNKANGMPESVTDRVRRAHEQWFHFTLNGAYFSAVDEIREPHLTRASKPGPEPKRFNTDRHDGGVPLSSRPRPPLGRLPGSVWTVASEPLLVPVELELDHFAAFPTEWPRKIIQGWSPTGICTACGQGRRPVSDYEQVNLSAGHNGRGTAVPNKPDGRAGESKALKVTITGYACACDQPTAPTRPAVVLDPFGGTGTTALVASVLGRHGISVDMSADYCRLAEWRTTDPDQVAAAMRVAKPPKQVTGQGSLFDELEEATA